MPSNKYYSFRIKYIITKYYSKKSGGSNVIKKYEDIQAFKQSCGVTSAMIARAALWNCSIFRKEGLVPMEDVLKRYLEIVRKKII